MNRYFVALVILYGIFIFSLSYKMTHAYFTDSVISSSNTFTAAAIFPARAGDVVINEINWAGNNTRTNGDQDEWIELRNMTNNNIDLSDWKIDGLGTGSSSATITSGSISAQGYFLISRLTESDSKSILNVTPDFHPSTAVALTNGGEQLILKNGNGVIIDTANLLPGWHAGDDIPVAKSMERNSVPGDGTLVGSWHNASTQVNFDSGAIDLGTPRAANSL